MPENENTNVQMNIFELQLTGSKDAEQLAIKSDVGTESSYTGPIAIKNIEILVISVRSNFTMHFNRCADASPGGKFNISFAGT